jgi:flagellar export protein FliJ
MSGNHKKPAPIPSLNTLVQVRSSEVDRLQADVVKQEASRARHHTSVTRLTQLAESSGPSGRPAGGSALSPALAVNCGDYKQAVLAMAEHQRTDLHLMDANLAVSQRNLSAAWTRRELLGKVLSRHEDAHARTQERAQRKRDDEIATQSWLAGRPG